MKIKWKVKCDKKCRKTSGKWILHSNGENEAEQLNKIYTQVYWKIRKESKLFCKIIGQKCKWIGPQIQESHHTDTFLWYILYSNDKDIYVV